MVIVSLVKFIERLVDKEQFWGLSKRFCSLKDKAQIGILYLVVIGLIVA